MVGPQVAEISSGALTLREITCWNALRKGLAVARAHRNAVVLAADTLVALDHKVIGKPADTAEARLILRRLSGRKHTVASGIFIGCMRSARAEMFCEISSVFFKKLSAGMIDAYLAKIDPLDKAGAYAVQGDGRDIIRRIVGSRSNVIGLPLEKTRVALARFEIRPQ